MRRRSPRWVAGGIARLERCILSNDDGGAPPATKRLRVPGVLGRTFAEPVSRRWDDLLEALRTAHTRVGCACGGTRHTGLAWHVQPSRQQGDACSAQAHDVHLAAVCYVLYSPSLILRFQTFELSTARQGSTVCAGIEIRKCSEENEHGQCLSHRLVCPTNKIVDENTLGIYFQGARSWAIARSCQALVQLGGTAAQLVHKGSGRSPQPLVRTRPQETAKVVFPKYVEQQSWQESCGGGGS